MLRDVLGAGIRPSWFEGSSDPPESRNPKDPPPIGAEREKLRLLPAFVHDRAPLLKFLGPRNRATGSARLLRLAGVHDQPALLEEGDRGGGCLLPPLARSYVPQKPLHPTHGQEDAISFLKSRVFRLPAASPDVQTEGVDGGSFVFV